MLASDLVEMSCQFSVPGNESSKIIDEPEETPNLAYRIWNWPVPNSLQLLGIRGNCKSNNNVPKVQRFYGTEQALAWLTKKLLLTKCC